MPFKAVFTALIFMCLTAPAHAQGLAGDPVAGKEISIKWCASCHAITPDQKIVQPGIISFMQIAKVNGVTMDSLIAIQTMPHQPMLDLDLSRKVKRDIAVYILTLRGK